MNPIVEIPDQSDDAAPPPVTIASDGRRKAKERKRERKSRRRSLMRLFNIPLTEVEKKRTLPPLPDSDRKMTDTMFLFLFVTYWIGMIAVGVLGYRFGKPASLIYGRDSEGRVCGDANAEYVIEDTAALARLEGLTLENDMTNKRFIVFPRIEKDLEFSAAGLEINLNPFDADFFRVCAANCPAEGDLVCTVEGEARVRRYQNETLDDSRTREELIRACVEE